MSREEAISIMNVIVHMLEPQYDTDRIEDAVEMAIEALEQEPCEDEYIKVPKKALKYRTAGMVAYNVAWLREHWQMEMDIVCGVKPCEDAISRQTVLDHIYGINGLEGLELSNVFEKHYADFIKSLPSVTPQQKIGHWNCGDDMFEYAICSSCKHETGEAWEYAKRNFKYCPNCGAKMERSDKE